MKGDMHITTDSSLRRSMAAMIALLAVGAGASTGTLISTWRTKTQEQQQIETLQLQVQDLLKFKLAMKEFTAEMMIQMDPENKQQWKRLKDSNNANKPAQ